MESSTRELRDGDRRARELYQYFQPDNPALLPTGRPIGQCTDSSTTLSAKASPNLVLTALAQLAAMKLGVQRAIISLIDRETLYVVAEASKSLNLDKNDIYDDDGDGLWMGCARGPVSGTLCEKTITLKPTTEQKYPFFIVNDLRQHPAFCAIPCVAEAPHFRYYAGTPLITTNGINIGSLYVIDPRPNLSLTESQKETLGNIADAVMDYMETARQSLEANRLAKVLSGLNSFVQADVNSDTSKKPAYQSVDLLGKDQSSIHQTLGGEKEHFSIKDTNKSPPVRSTSQANSAEDSDDFSTDAAHCPPSPDREPRSQKISTLPSNHASSRIHRTFQHAANSIRQSLDLGKDGGVVIFGTDARAEPDSHNGLGEDPDPKSRLANIWAISDRPSNDGNSPVSHPHPAAQMDLHFARRILRRYRRGGLWNFHQDGTAFSSDEDEVSSGERDVAGLSPPPLSVHPNSFGALREKDLQALKKYFPNAKRIMFVPLWDSFNSRWFGGCFSWSCLETRVFSAHVELGGFFGFGSSLMVEYSRIQSQESDKKKDDFISTISHELRSPLHGILAANEFLAEYVQSEFARRLLDTISACGQTLLDTFEQILDFAKINSFESKRQRSGSRSPPLRNRQRINSGDISQQPLRLLKLVDVVAVIEDVIESVYSGQILSGAMTSGNNTSGRWSLDTTGDHNGTAKLTKLERIDVFIDAAPRNWEFVLEPGALRRVVMNVFGNALKYTEAGTVSVRLEILKADVNTSSKLSEGSGSPELFLTVSDTGKGISSQYLRSDIFTPFSQEDVLSPGTGLGLSLVRKILRPLNGNISIESQLGVGTTVKMTFPLTQPQQHKILEPNSSISDSSNEATNLIKQVRAGLEGKFLHFITAQDPAFVTPPSNLMITNYLTEWFGMKTWTRESTAPIDFLVVNEHELDLVVNTQHESIIIVLCHRSPRTWSTITGANKLPSKAICLTLPCGPHQLARTLLGSVNCMTPNQPLGLAEPSPVEFTERLSEINHLLNHHSLSTTQAMGPTSTLDTSHSEAIPNKGPSITLDRDVPKSDPALNFSTTQNGSLVESVISETHVSLTTDATSGVRILLVEDNAINLALLEKYLARTKPHTLHTATNGQKAVDSVQKMSTGYHYIFMDLSMPVMDGFEATRKIRLMERAGRAGPPAKIIALTGLGSDEHIRKAYAAGVDVFLTKPISFKDILRLLDGQKDQS